MKRQFMTAPPNIPLYLYKHRPDYTLPRLIEWAKQELEDRINYCAKRGYLKEYLILTKEYSAMRVLAEMSGFRRICANAVQNEDGWNRMTGRERVFIRRSYELRDLLLRNS